ncbi:hypothetical protein KJ365_10340 [Glaciecola sp. XM2]|uniref:hypothetical protein n=1 Tax=Glaciecola sp. XM2 TaxID=1914931 RepID=UPI001BDEFD84|nr:hypothetical protein [Glaciecola sp. XM2]MBT1451273.1 hypothetical protein [Glaciecola sp. XM2]
MKKFTQLIASALLLGSVSANATVIIFDGNNGGVNANIPGGTVETGMGTSVNSTDVVGDPLTFNDFVVTAGLGNTPAQGSSINFANSNFSVSTHVNMDGRAVYQDVTPAHGGLGAWDGQNNNSDNLTPNQCSPSQCDEVLFFDFGVDTVLNTVWFNGNHTELTSFTDNSGNDVGDTLFNIYFSVDGDSFTRVFNSQQSPTMRDYLDTNATDAYRYWAVSATGWNYNSGGYVEAISFSKVSTPSAIVLMGLMFVGLAFKRSRK